MEKSTPDLFQQKQDGISLVLIILNIFLAFVFVFCTPQREDDVLFSLLGVAVLASLMQGIFVFTYKGKAPILSKWILAIFVLITLVYGLFIGYVIALSGAFQH